MRTSFHHQPEAQHPKSPATYTPAGRLPHLWDKTGQTTPLAQNRAGAWPGPRSDNGLPLPSRSSPFATLLSLGCLALLTLPRHCVIMSNNPLLLLPHGLRTLLALARPVRTRMGALDHARRNLYR